MVLFEVFLADHLRVEEGYPLLEVLVEEGCAQTLLVEGLVRCLMGLVVGRLWQKDTV
jgi:hypothetical protein